jgi:hypothetical protein
MGSLLLITMQFGLRGMDELQVRYDQEAITQIMFSVISATQQSNILQGKAYKYLDISFTPK